MQSFISIIVLSAIKSTGSKVGKLARNIKLNAPFNNFVSLKFISEFRVQKYIFPLSTLFLQDFQFSEYKIIGFTFQFLKEEAFSVLKKRGQG